MLDLRLQFAAMMADTHLVSASLAGGGGGGGGGGGSSYGGGGGRGGGKKGGEWADDPRHPCNRCGRRAGPSTPLPWRARA
jgi:hypothetical protein